MQEMWPPMLLLLNSQIHMRKDIAEKIQIYTHLNPNVLRCPMIMGRSWRGAVSQEGLSQLVLPWMRRVLHLQDFACGIYMLYT